MFRYIAFRLPVTIPVLFVVSILVFIIIQLPPGDFFDNCRFDDYEDCERPVGQ